MPESPLSPAEFFNEAERLYDYTKYLRRDIHTHPELGFQEVRTASIVARELTELGLEVTTGVAETGVVALLEGSSAGPVVMLRFDMDALPVQEETGAGYASTTPGVMHACGHDGHVAIGLTAARLLHAHRKQLAGTLKFVFQPAEEGLGGAKRMIQEGALASPHPDWALGLHLWNEKPLGWLGISGMPVMAASDTFTLHILGRGGHGAAPNQTLDPVAAAAQIITALQTIVSRNVPPLQSAVISVTALSAGEAYNVIPGSVEMRGTIRTFDPGIRQTVHERLSAIAEGVAGAMGCQAEVMIRPLTSAVVNQPEVAAQIRAIASVLLPDSTIDSSYATMISEDMSDFLNEIPGCFFFVGSANAEKGLNAAHHHPRFDFDERAMPRAAALISAAAAELMSTPVH